MHKWNEQLSKLIPQFDSHRWQAADLDFSVDPRMSQDDFFLGSTLRIFDLWVDWVWSGAISPRGACCARRPLAHCLCSPVATCAARASRRAIWRPLPIQTRVPARAS